MSMFGWSLILAKNFCATKEAMLSRSTMFFTSWILPCITTGGRVVKEDAFRPLNFLRFLLIFVIRLRSDSNVPFYLTVIR